MNNVVCDYCGKDRHIMQMEVRDTNYGFPGTYTIVECANCGLVYLNPRPEPNEIGNFYPSETYHPFQSTHQDGHLTPSDEEVMRARQLTERLGTGQLLDVGTGSGRFLLAMDDLGWHAEGVEPNAKAVHSFREVSNLNLRLGDIFEINSPESYHLITFWDVLEHTLSPRLVLTHAHEILVQAGHMAIHVPNWDSIERRIFGSEWTAIDAPRHLHHFSPLTLGRMVKDCGFDIIDIKAQATSLSLASNMLRWAGRDILRRGKPASESTTNPDKGEVPGSARFPRILRLVHEMARIPNAIANLLNRGAGITLIARKSD